MLSETLFAPHNKDVVASGRLPLSLGLGVK